MAFKPTDKEIAEENAEEKKQGEGAGEERQDSAEAKQRAARRKALQGQPPSAARNKELAKLAREDKLEIWSELDDKDAMASKKR